MKDRRRSNLWILNTDGTGHEALTTGNHSDARPRFSPDGTRLLYVSDADGSPQLYCRWLASGRSARLTHRPSAPVAPVWSPDGRSIAFASHVPQKSRPFVELPTKPEGAEWAPLPRMIRKTTYRFDGAGYLPDEKFQLFVVSAEGGSPRQVTEGDFDHGAGFLGGGFTWAGNKALVYAATHLPADEMEMMDSELYEVSLADGHVRTLTDRRGPDHDPVVSPDAQSISYLGFDDRRQGYQLTRLYVMDREGKDRQTLSADFDHSIRAPTWARDSQGIYFLYDEKGNTHIGYVGRTGGPVKTIARDVGGTNISRPYESGAFSVGPEGTVAWTQTHPGQPAEVTVLHGEGSSPHRLTSLNDELRQDRSFAEAEEVWFTSSHDGRKVQGWVLKPPGFDAHKKYPMILEIHGGPFANYGDRFAAELQLYAAAGYVVFYCNPRGSTSYGEEFGNLIHHAYPGHDYEDLMSGVDEVVHRGYVDADHLYVTGGSGGGVLTCWIVGKTHRFRAAVSTYPVINWYSFVLTADMSPFFTRYWFPGMPWEQAEHYLKRSPLSLVGNVSTPTMLMTGEEDFRTPISEAEQFYKALKMRKVDAALVRVPGAGHNISARPSHMIAKVAYVLKWFETHR